MSLFPPDELRIGLCMDRLVVARFRRRLIRELIDEQVHPIDRDPIEHLRKLSGDCAIHVVLSSYFVRYQLLPWSDALNGEEEWTTYAEHRFASIYGEAAKGWEVRVANGKKRQARVATAIDRPLLEDLRSIRGVVSVEPYLVAAFNAYHRALPNESWLVLHEPGRFTIGLVTEGTWRTVRTRQAKAFWTASLGDVLEREANASGNWKCDRVAVHAEAKLPERAGRFHVMALGESNAAAERGRVKTMALA